MKTREVALVYIVEIVISILVGLFSSRFLPGPESFLTGLLFFLVLQLLVAQLTLGKVERVAELLSVVLYERDPEDAFSEILLVYSLRVLSGGFSSKEVIVPKDLSWDFWKDCIGRTSHIWRATNYTRHKWDSAWGTLATHLQEERVKCGCMFERIFLLDSVGELDDARRIARQHSQAGIKTGWLLMSDFASDPNVKDAYDELKTYDVVLVDNQWACLTHLDSDRHAQRVVATKEPIKVREARILVNEAVSKAKPFEFLEPDKGNNVRDRFEPQQSESL